MQMLEYTMRLDWQASSAKQKHGGRHIPRASTDECRSHYEELQGFPMQGPSRTKCGPRPLVNGRRVVLDNADMGIMMISLHICSGGNSLLLVVELRSPESKRCWGQFQARKAD